MNPQTMLEYVLGAWAHTYEFDLLGNQQDPVDELAYILLSAKTRDATFRRTFCRLRELYPDWNDVVCAPLPALIEILGSGGLQVKKALWLQSSLAEIRRREGAVDLSRLHCLDDQEMEAYLRGLPGVGIKSARCIMMYSFHRQVLPVDAHVFRTMGRLGLLPIGATYRGSHNTAQELVPAQLRLDFHVYAVIHGRKTCLPRNPPCDSCCLVEWCPRVGV